MKIYKISIRIFTKLIKTLFRFHFYDYSENINLHIYPQSNIENLI